jgi:hypothetical protein
MPGGLGSRSINQPDFGGVAEQTNRNGSLPQQPLEAQLRGGVPLVLAAARGHIQAGMRLGGLDQHQPLAGTIGIGHGIGGAQHLAIFPQ